MSLLLPLPAMGILMVQAVGSREAITQAMIIFQVSVRKIIEVQDTFKY
jgi:alpha-1,3-mannosyltransferase